MLRGLTVAIVSQIPYCPPRGCFTDPAPKPRLPKADELITLHEILFTNSSHPPTKPILADSAR